MVLKYLSKILSTDLPRRPDTFPNAKVAKHPADQQTHSQLPPDAAQLLDASGHGEHPPPGERARLIQGAKIPASCRCDLFLNLCVKSTLLA